MNGLIDNMLSFITEDIIIHVCDKFYLSDIDKLKFLSCSKYLNTLKIRVWYTSSVYINIRSMNCWYVNRLNNIIVDAYMISVLNKFNHVTHLTF